MPTISRALAAPENDFKFVCMALKVNHRGVGARPTRSGLGAAKEPDDVCVWHDDGPVPVGALQI